MKRYISGNACSSDEFRLAHRLEKRLYLGMPPNYCWAFCKSNHTFSLRFFWLLSNTFQLVSQRYFGYRENRWPASVIAWCNIVFCCTKSCCAANMWKGQYDSSATLVIPLCISWNTTFVPTIFPSSGLSSLNLPRFGIFLFLFCKSLTHCKRRDC